MVKNKQDISEKDPPALHSHIAAAFGTCWVVLMAYLYGFDRLSSAVTATLAADPAILFNVGPHLDLPRLIASLFWLACLFGAAALGGRLLLRCFKFEDLSFHEEILFGLGIGLGACSLLALALGLAGVFSPIMLRVFFIGMGIVVLSLHAWHPISKDILASQLPTSEKSAPPRPSPGCSSPLLFLSISSEPWRLRYFTTRWYTISRFEAISYKSQDFPDAAQCVLRVPFNTEIFARRGIGA